MQFYTKQHKFYCGIDLHTKKMYVCILDEKGEIREHRNMNTNPESFLAAIAPYREDIVVAVECMFTCPLMGGTGWRIFARKKVSPSSSAMPST